METINRIKYEIVREAFDNDRYRVGIHSSSSIFKTRCSGSIYDIDATTVENIRQELISNYENKRIRELKEQSNSNWIGFIGTRDKLEAMEELIGIMCQFLHEANLHEERTEQLVERYVHK